MAQILSIIGLGKAVGIVTVLILAGIALKVFSINVEASNFAIWGGIIIGLALGTLGVFGVIRRIFS